ncbi:MAG TPA: thiol-disulfide oxidoreductase DCC family protein [Elainellaceae cyanobacterium]
MTLSDTQSNNSQYQPGVQTASSPSWEIKLLYDGECPLCLREVEFLKRRDAGQGRIAFVDISDENYDPEQHEGIDFESAMGQIHAVLPDGTVITDLEVFRRVYEILGIGWIYAPTRLPILRPIANAIYGIWAKWRLALTGRPDLATIIAERQNRVGCDSQD